MKFINLAIALLVGFTAARQRQAGVKSLLATGSITSECESCADKVLVNSSGDKGCPISEDEFSSGGSCKIRDEAPTCNLESDSPKGTVSVSVGSSESYNIKQILEYH